MSGLPLSPFSSKPPGSPPSSTKKPPSSSPSSSSSSSSILGYPEFQDVNPVLISDRIGEHFAHGGRLNFIHGGGFVLIAQDLSVLGQDDEVYTAAADTVMMPNEDQINAEENPPLVLGGENLAVHGGGGGGVVFLRGGGFYLVQIDHVTPEVIDDQNAIIYQEIPPVMDNQIDEGLLGDGENLDAVHHGSGDGDGDGGAFVFIDQGGGFDFIDQDVAPVLGPFDPEVVIQNDDQDENPIPNAVNPQINIIPDHDQAAAAAAAARLQRWLLKKTEKREKEEEQRIAKQFESDAVTVVQDHEHELFRLENPELFNDQSSIPPSSEDDPVPATSCNMCPRSRFRSVEARRKHQKVHQGYSVE